MFIFPAPTQPGVAVLGQPARFPVHRIYCVGRNYAEHAKEMGSEASRETPTFFQKPADAVMDNRAVIPYPPGTSNFHYEVELVLALKSGGLRIGAERALDCVYGYAVGLDLTRRDLQVKMKDKGMPWDIAKAFDFSAPVSAIAPAEKVGHPATGRLWLEVNGALRQQADIADMVFSVPEIIVELSKLFELKAGDLIFTGTPAGVGPLQPGDRFRAGFADLVALEGSIGAAR